MNPNQAEQQHNVQGSNEATPQDARFVQLENFKMKEAKQKGLKSTANMQGLANPTLPEKRHNAELIDDGTPQTAKLVLLEIAKMRESAQKSLENVTNLKRKFDAEQKIVQEKQAAKMKLQKEIAELQGKSDEGKHQYNTMKTHLGKMREMSKEIGNFCIQNEQTLKVIRQDKTIRRERNVQLQKTISDALAKFEDVCTKKENEVELKKEAVLNQQKINQDTLETRENECLRMAEKLEDANKELQTLKGLSDELKQANDNCLHYISDNEKDNKQLKEVWQHKQKSSDNLLEQTEEELRAFEQRKEEIFNSLDEARQMLQKKETEIEGVQRGIRNQTEYNKNFQEKLAAKIKEVADLRLQNDQLDAVQKEKELELASNEQGLVSKLNSKLEEKQTAKALLCEERKILSKTEEQMKDAKQINKDVMLRIEMQENIISDLKNKQNSQLEAITTFEQNISSLQLKLDNLKKEECEWQTKFVAHESDMQKTIASKTAAVNSVIADIEAIQAEEKEATAAILEEMNSIKRNFDIQTAQEADAFKEKDKQLQQQIFMIEKDLSHTRNLQVQLDDELQQLNNDCDNISEKIKEQNSLTSVFATFPQADFRPASLPAPSSVRSRTSRPGSASSASQGLRTGRAAPSGQSKVGYTSTPSTSTLTLPPAGPVKPRAFDELSGSSAEGNVVTFNQMLEYKRLKQLREQKRLKHMKFSLPQDRF